MAVAERACRQTIWSHSAVEDRPRRESTLPITHEDRQISGCLVGDGQVHDPVAKVDRLDGDRVGCTGERLPIDRHRRSQVEMTAPLVLEYAGVRGHPVGTDLGERDIREIVVAQVSRGDGSDRPARVGQGAELWRALKRAIAVSHMNSIRGNEVDRRSETKETALGDRSGTGKQSRERLKRRRGGGQVSGELVRP